MTIHIICLVVAYISTFNFEFQKVINIFIFPETKLFSEGSRAVCFACCYLEKRDMRKLLMFSITNIQPSNK